MLKKIHRSIVATAAGLLFGALAVQAADSPQTIYQMLEREKQSTQIYKAYFPDLVTARKAAITFHEQLLESQYDAGYLVMELDAKDMDRLRPFGFRFEHAAEFIRKRDQFLNEMQALQLRRLSGGTAGTGTTLSAAAATTVTTIPNYSCYETVEGTFAQMQAFVDARSDLASITNAGVSWEKLSNQGGFDIKVLKLTNSAITGVEKPKLFVNSAIHAREYTTAPLVLEFARWLVNGHGVNADATWILDHHEVHLMLHANPDGRKKAETGLSWRKNTNNAYCANTNTRGADLNRNFTFAWNSTSGQGSSGTACNETYRGPSAGSEPETQAVESYIRSLWPDRRGQLLADAAPADTSGIHLDIHSYSQLVLWPWGTTSTPAPNGTALQTLGRKFAWFNGYTPQQSIGLYPTDGTSDGPSYGELGVAAFTVELGTSFFEKCTTYDTVIKPNNLPLLIYAAKVVRTPYTTPSGPDVTAITLSGDASGGGVAPGTAVTISASATDTRFNNSNGTEPTQAVAAAEAYINLPPWQTGAVPVPLSAADGSFNATTEALTGSLSTAGLPVGRHTIFVRARDAGGTWGAVSAVFLNVTNTPAAIVSEVESNNTLAAAQVVSASHALVNGTISKTTDVDFYRVSLAAGGTLTATLTPNATSNYDLSIYNAAGTVVASSSNGAGLVDVARFANPGSTAVSVSVRVNRVSGATGSSGTYTLRLQQ